jgi:hypothetical protein
MQAVSGSGAAREGRGMPDDEATPGTRRGLDDAKPQRLLRQMLGDLSGAASVAMVRMGDALSLNRALHAKGAMTYAELTREAKVNERHMHEWLPHQVASNYLS